MLLVQGDPTAFHGKLESTMFWVGAAMAFVPFAAALGLIGFLYWNRRRRRAEADAETRTPPA